MTGRLKSSSDLQWPHESLLAWVMANGWCWFVLKEKYCWLVVDKPSE
jgi:hypothetical protein